MMLVIIMLVTNSSENISDNSDDHGNDTNNGHNESVVYSLSVSKPRRSAVREVWAVYICHACQQPACFVYMSQTCFWIQQFRECAKIGGQTCPLSGHFEHLVSKVPTA